MADNSNSPKMRSRFARLMAETGNPLYAASHAGYAHPRHVTSRMLHDPRVAAKIDHIRKAREMLESGVPFVVRAHVKRLRAKATSNREFAALVVPYYRAAGLYELDSVQERPTHELSASELQVKLAALEREASNRALPIAAREVSILD